MGLGREALAFRSRNFLDQIEYAEHLEGIKYHKQYLSVLHNIDLIYESVMCGANLNNVVPNNGFPAYDIAVKMYKDSSSDRGSSIVLTAKQRQAFINVLAHFKSDE